jgi:hypothetical protein
MELYDYEKQTKSKYFRISGRKLDMNRTGDDPSLYASGIESNTPRWIATMIGLGRTRASGLNRR